MKKNLAFVKHSSQRLPQKSHQNQSQQIIDTDTSLSFSRQAVLSFEDDGRLLNVLPLNDQKHICFHNDSTGERERDVH